MRRRDTLNPFAGSVPVPQGDARYQMGVREGARDARQFKRRQDPRRPEPVLATGVDMLPQTFTLPANKLTRVLPYNKNRKRFLLCLVDTAPATVYWCFGNSPNSLIPLPPGGIWDESGVSIATSEIWMTTGPQNVPTSQPVTVYEGMHDDRD
ncbi:MAG: hypothetical protein ACREHV_11780 [Rhizomicrobium sp.]